MSHREVQEEITVGRLIDVDSDESTGQQVAACPMRAADQGSLRQVACLKVL